LILLNQENVSMKVDKINSAKAYREKVCKQLEVFSKVAKEANWRKGFPRLIDEENWKKKIICFGLNLIWCDILTCPIFIGGQKELGLYMP
jgi:hypothetical protein